MSGHELLLNIAGGVALLLWATRMVRTGIMRAYGAELRRLLGRFTRSRVNAFGLGVAVSAALQSSTATALLISSFADKALIGVAAGLALMLGADLGSTLVVQALSFDIAWLSPALILVGVVSFLAGPAPQARHLGRVAIGLGLMLLALGFVVGASAQLRESETLQYVLQPLSEDPILAVLLAAVITWVAHSSVAMVLLVMSLAAAGVVPLLLGFALVLGANIGSGVIPVALTISGSGMARRIPLGNLLFRALGAILCLPLLEVLAPLVPLLGDAPARQIANFHTGFNLALALLFLPATGLMARLVLRLLRSQVADSGPIKPKYLDPTVVDRPQIALAAATREVLRLADIVETMLRGVIDVLRSDDAKLIEQLSELDDQVDDLHEAIKLYVTDVSRNARDADDSKRCIDIITFNTNLEHIGDIIDKNLLDIAQKKVRNKLSFSNQGWEELLDLHTRTLKQMQLAISVFVSGDLETARQLITEKERFRAHELEAGQSHLGRLRSGRIESIETSALHLDIIRDLKRVYSHLTSVAYPILETSGELRESRLKDRDARHREGSEDGGEAKDSPGRQEKRDGALASR
ncbi:MAG: Na/Pi cotransporter family protein [Kiloniellales bacterium]